MRKLKLKHYSKFYIYKTILRFPKKHYFLEVWLKPYDFRGKI